MFFNWGFKVQEKTIISVKLLLLLVIIAFRGLFIKLLDSYLHNFFLRGSVTFQYNSLYTQAVPYNTYAESNFELGKPVHSLAKKKPPGTFSRFA